MVQYSLKLAKELDVDLETVEISAWLHDIGSIIDGREEHYITGAKNAREKLKELNYPSQKNGQVEKCILNHRGSIKNKWNQLNFEKSKKSSVQNMKRQCFY